MLSPRKIALQAAVALCSVATIPTAQAGANATKPWIIVMTNGELVGTSGVLYKATLDLTGYANKEECLVEKGRFQQALIDRQVDNVMAICAYVPGLPKK